MVFSLKNLLLYTAGMAIALIVIDSVRFYLLVRKSNILVENSAPFKRVIPDSKMNILVLGDSTAVGTGAEDSSMSTAGRLGAFYPEATITNLGKNGLRLEGLLGVIDTMDPEEEFSIILVQIGANDIVRLTSMKEIQVDAEKIFFKLSKQTNKLIILHSGNIGESKIFPFYTRPLLSKRSLAMRGIYMQLANKYGANYVDLINASAGKSLRDYPETYYADDLFHLNGYGYGLWFTEISKFL